MIRRTIFSGLLILAFILGFTANPTMAGDADRIGTSGASQLQVPVGARDIALMGSNLALTSGLDAMYWNPAGVPRMDNVAAAAFSTMNIFSDISVNYLAAAYNDEDVGSIGISIKSFGFGDIPWTTNEDMDAASGKTFSPTFVTLGFTYARALTEVISVGVNMKIVNESIDRASASTVAFDIGLQYDQLGGIDGVSFGVAVKNIGGDMQYKGSGLGNDFTVGSTGRTDFGAREAASDQLPTSIELGAAYKSQFNEDNSLAIMGNFVSNNFENDAVKAGLEYSFQNMLFARGGYNYAMNLESTDQLYTFAVGAGINYPLGDVDFRFDYAYRHSEYFDANNIFTIFLGF